MIETSQRKYMKELLQILKSFRGRLIAVSLLYTLQTVCALYLSSVVGDIVTFGIAENDMDYIIKSGLLMIAAALLSFILGVILSKINSECSTKLIADTQKRIFAKINTLTNAEFGSIGAGGLITRSTDDIFHIQWVVGSLLYGAISVPIMLIGGTVLTMLKDRVLGVAMIVAVPVVLVLVFRFAKNLDTFWELSDKFIDIQNSAVRERLSGIRVIRSFDQEEKEHQKIAKATDIMASYIIKANIRSGSISSICTLLLNVMTLAVVALSFPRISGGSTDAGSVISALQYISLASNGLLTLTWGIIGLPHTKVCVKRIAEVFDFIGEPQTEGSEPAASGDVALENVSYFYPDAKHPAIDDVNIKIKQGEIVAIIGATGSGKSTIIKLLLRFFDPTSGTISIGGKKYSETDLKSTRKAFSVALQKSMIFEGSVAENIRFGNADATDEEIKRASEIAMISEFIESQPDGYNHRLAKMGTNVSGGQKQRIAIARALIKDAPIYIFDDSFSALDYLTESKLRFGLNAALVGKTQIIVTQRSATAMHCDRIFVMDKGKIVGEGTHAELMKSCAIYNEIYKSQHGGNGDENR